MLLIRCLCEEVACVEQQKRLLLLLLPGPQTTGLYETRYNVAEGSDNETRLVTRHFMAQGLQRPSAGSIGRRPLGYALGFWSEGTA